jgi:hypothetical protein
VNKQTALSLASRGIRIFPCNPNKTPMVKAWESAANCSPFAIEVRWNTDPQALPAIPVGVQGLVVIDCDRKTGRPDGVAAFHVLCNEHGIDLSSAFVVETPSTGKHYYFRTETPYGNSPGSLPAGSDVRGVGGYVIAPGSTLPDGRSYRIIAGTWDGIPALPDTLAAFLCGNSPAVTLKAPAEAVRLAVSDREKAFAEAALADEVAKLSAMGEGSGRNAALNQAAHSLGTMNGWIDPNTIASELLAASTVNGYIAKDGEAAAIKTIESGINAGMAKPRPLLGLPADIESIDVSWIGRAIAIYKARHTAEIAKPIKKRSVTLLQGSEIQERPITWLWDGYLPAGKLTLLAGAGGTGKSTIAFNIAGTITNAGLWPDGTRCNAVGNVLIWSSEDDPADTIKPRLMAVSANDSRYGVISGTLDEHGISCPFDAALDMEGLREAVSRIGGISLLIIDPIVTAVTGDMHKANDVRRSLQAIVDFAAECNCAVLGITHFAKGTAGRNSAERVIGSQAFAALARMVLVAAKEEESSKRVFTRAKSNNSIDTGGFSYTIEALTLKQNIVTTRVVWGEPLEGSSRSILAEVEGDAVNGEGSQLSRAKKFLQDSLTGGFVPARELLEHAREGQGLSCDTVRRAQKELGIRARKLSMNGGWVWELPA